VSPRSGNGAPVRREHCRKYLPFLVSGVAFADRPLSPAPRIVGAAAFRRRARAAWGVPRRAISAPSRKVCRESKDHLTQGKTAIARTRPGEASGSCRLLGVKPGPRLWRAYAPAIAINTVAAARRGPGSSRNTSSPPDEVVPRVSPTVWARGVGHTRGPRRPPVTLRPRAEAHEPSPRPRVRFYPSPLIVHMYHEGPASPYGFAVAFHLSIAAPAPRVGGVSTPAIPRTETAFARHPAPDLLYLLELVPRRSLSS